MSTEANTARLPPGQALTAHFPIVGEQAPASIIAAADWALCIEGHVERPCTLRLEALLARPVQQRRIDIHCVTGWSRRDVLIEGWPLAEVLAPLGLKPQAAWARFVAHSTRGHDTTLPLALALRDTWLVHRMDGVALSVEHGGPLRSLTPGRYFYKSLKWLARIELLDADVPGYWERESAYHNAADPWREQRFDEARVAPAADVAVLRAATDFSQYRNRVWIKARLGGWDPQSRDLSGLQLKYCSLRNAQLDGVDFRGANLSLSSLEGASLREAQFTDCDVEGASFAGADLRGAVFERVAASATRFYRDFAGGQRLAARVDGLRLKQVSGLLEDQLQFLRAAGAHLD